MTRGAWLWVTLAVLTVGLCTSCDKLKEMAGQKGSGSAGADAPAAPGGDGDPDAELGQKLNQYIECINKASSSALRSRSRYLGWVDPKTGPTGQERNVYGLFQINLVDQCKKALKKAQTMKPDTPDLDKAAAEYEKALDKLKPLVDSAYDYYNQKDYKDDQMKKGKEMHGPLIAAFDEFAKADRGLRDRIAAINDKMAARELANIEKNEGKKLLWHWKSMMLKAKHLVRVGDVPDLPELDLDQYDPALKDYEAAVKELDSYASGHGAETKKVMMFSSAVGEAKDFLKAAKEMMRRKRDKKEWSQSEIMQINSNNGWMVDGHPAQFVRKYNDLVNRSNGLRW